MRQIVKEVNAVVEEGISGAFNPIDRYDYESVAPGSNPNQAQFRLRFPSDFVDTDAIQGAYNFKMWLENLPIQTDVAWNYLLTTTPSAKATTALPGGTAVPRKLQEVSNIAKATYYSGNILGFIQVQPVVGASAQAYDTNKQDRADPQIVIEFERQSVPQLDAITPSPESDHLWTFSQADLYVIVNGQRWLLGWIADEDLEMSDYQDSVNFQKGKPSANAVTFMSKINAKIAGKIASYDPWLMSKLMHIEPNVQNNRIVFTEVNKQRPIENFEFSLEWNTNAGHACQFTIPKGQLWAKETQKPGSNEIARYSFEIEPLVTRNRKVCELKVTQTPVQRLVIPIGYTIS